MDKDLGKEAGLEMEDNKIKIRSVTGLLAVAGVAAIVGITALGIVEETTKPSRPSVRYMNDWKQDGKTSKDFILPDGRLGMMYAGKHDLLDSWPCNDFARLSEITTENVNTCVVVKPRGM